MQENKYVRLALTYPPGEGGLGEIIVYSSCEINFYKIINLFNEQTRKADIGEISYQRDLILMSIYATDQRIKALTEVSHKLVNLLGTGNKQSIIFARDLEQIKEQIQQEKNRALSRYY